MSFNIKYTYDLVDKMSKDLRKIQKSLKETERQTKKTERGMRASFARITRSARKLGTRVGGILRKMKKGFLAVTAAAIGSSVSFATLELGLVNIKNLLSKEDALKYADQLKKMQEEGVKAGFTIESTNKALFDTISAMGASENAFSTFRQAQILATAGVTELSVATDGMTSIINAYGRESTDAAAVANAFFTAQKAGKTTVEELSSSIGKIASNAKVAGIGFEELLATISALTLAGLPTAEAVTGLRGALKSLINPSNDAKKVLKAIGAPTSAAELQAIGLTKALTILAEASQKFGVDAIAQAIPEMEAFNAIASLSADKLKILDGTVKQVAIDIKDGTGLTEAYGNVNDTMSKKFHKASGSFKIFAGDVGSTFAEPLKRGLSSAAANLGDASKMIKNPSLILESLSEGRVKGRALVQSVGANKTKDSSDEALQNKRQKGNLSGTVEISMKNVPPGTSAKFIPAVGSNLGPSSAYVGGRN